MTGVTAVLGGIISASQTLIGTSVVGSTYGLDCICATVLGGTSMAGGKGNVPGMFFAALLLGFLKNALNMLNLPFYYQYIVTGLTLIFALVMGNLHLLISEKRV
jgi:ribose/xylose/arabinose/galactoside ABC-type transport system permease subunit